MALTAYGVHDSYDAGNALDVLESGSKDAYDAQDANNAHNVYYAHDDAYNVLDTGDNALDVYNV